MNKQEDLKRRAKEILTRPEHRQPKNGRVERKTDTVPVR